LKRILSVCVLIVCSFFGYSQTDSGIPNSVKGELSVEGSSYSALVDSIWVSQLESHELIYNYRVNLDTAQVIKDLPDSVYLKRFEELDNNSPFDLSYNPAVEKYIKEYLRYSSHLKKIMGLAEFYFPLMEQELDANNIPLELKYLSVIESALNPEAKSPVGASGLWQFMLPTGKECGLIINSYLDERNDPIASTKAACLYLNRLYEIYGVWELAISAYNCGPGNVNKAIKRAGGTKNYWELRPYLPRETQKYVPRFMSILYLMTYGQDHNIMPVSPDFSYWQTDTVLVKNKIRFDQITSITSIQEEELKLLNPQYRRNIIPAREEGSVLVLPVKKIAEFIEFEKVISAHKPHVKKEYVSNVKENQPKKNSSSNKDKITYKVKPGDVLGTIADRYGVSVSQLKSWNNIRGTRIKVGQNLVIYVKKTSRNQTVAVPSAQNEFTFYTVRNGDTLWEIAKRYPGVSAEQIRKWNSSVNPKNLKAGTKLKIFT